MSNKNLLKLKMKEQKIKEVKKKVEKEVVINLEEEKQTETKFKTFEELGLSESSLNAIKKKGYEKPSEIQEKIIPLFLEKKHDIIGIAQTGTGKTAAFGLPILDLIGERNKSPKAIILAPTRELAIQVCTEIDSYKGTKRVNVLTVYGGSPIQTQIRQLRSGTDIVVGTPGRVLDLINRGELQLKDIEYFVLDEADEMLKMGFIEDIELILSSANKDRKVLLFSATMPERIKDLSKKYMKNQKVIEVKKKEETTLLIKQIFYKIREGEKLDTLLKIIEMESFIYAIIFCKTKSDVEKLTKELRRNKFEADCIHGDITQSKREKILAKFREQRLNILVATDVAARGIDAPNLTHVINYSLPQELETYVHRIGRTGRAGKSGIAISFITPRENGLISRIERMTKSIMTCEKVPNEKEVLVKKNEKINVEIEEIIKTKDLSKYLEITNQLLAKNDGTKVICALLNKLLETKTQTRSSSDREDSSRDRRSSRDRDDRSDRRDSSRSNSRDREDRPTDRRQRDDKRTTRDDRSPRNNKRENSRSGVRLFVAKGKMDSFTKHKLIDFLEKESGVSINNSSDVKILDKFSFITLDDKNTANKIVETFEKQNRKRSIVEIAAD